MASVNKVIILGNLGKDPESRTLPSGETVCNFSVATTEVWKDKATGERKEATEWHRVTFFGRQAEIATQYLRKGSPVYVEGSLRTRKWTDQNGQERYTTEIRGETLRLLGSRQDGGGENTADYPAHAQSAPQPAPTSRPSPQAAAKRPAPAFEEDDIPF